MRLCDAVRRKTSREIPPVARCFDRCVDVVSATVAGVRQNDARYICVYCIFLGIFLRDYFGVVREEGCFFFNFFFDNLVIG